MTELQVVARELVEESTRAQGLPFHVEDPEVLARVATLLSQRLHVKEVIASASR
jgi:hypothetical protein